MSSLKKKLLLLLSSSVDTIIDWDKTISSPYLNIKFSSYKQRYFEEKVRGMLKTGDIEKIIRHGEPAFRITSQGSTKLIHSVPMAKRIGREWDGRWRMVIFDIPEINKERRDKLRKKLKDLGFAKWQESVYITPFDIGRDLAEYLSVVNLSNDALALEVKKFFIGDEKEIARNLWHLDDINIKYYELYKKYNDKKDKQSFSSNKRGLQEEYLSILEDDPYLPVELLPKPWWRNKVKNFL